MPWYLRKWHLRSVLACCTLEVGQGHTGNQGDLGWLQSRIWNEISSLCVNVERCHTSAITSPKKRKKKKPGAKPGAISKQASRQGEREKEGEAGWTGLHGFQWMDTAVRGAMLENPPSILGFKVLGCKCVHSACIRFNKWLGCLVQDSNVHIYKHEHTHAFMSGQKTQLSVKHNQLWNSWCIILNPGGGHNKSDSWNVRCNSKPFFISGHFWRQTFTILQQCSIVFNWVYYRIPNLRQHSHSTTMKWM